MQTFAHVIAEWNYGRWTAWFSHEPDTVCGGHDWACAVAILIDVHGSPRLRWQQLVRIEEKTRDGHAEFLVPYVSCLHQTKVVSLN